MSEVPLCWVVNVASRYIRTFGFIPNLCIQPFVCNHKTIAHPRTALHPLQRVGVLSPDCGKFGIACYRMHEKAQDKVILGVALLV